MVLNQYDKSMFVKNEQGRVDVTNPENVQKMAILLKKDHPEIYKRLEEGMTQTNVLDDFDTSNNVRPGYNEYSKDTSHIPEHLKKIPQVYGKRICYENPMFHVCVENVKHNNWYTEKIGEALCTKTVPIFWGCPNIGEYYDSRGIITFETEEELVNIVNNLTPELYKEMKPYIDYNYNIALIDSFQNKIITLFNEIIKLNNL
jgi:hypothetical protein